MCGNLFIKKIICIVPFLLLFVLKVFAQSYNFTNYNLKDGLPQSQVMAFYQAKDRTLWLCTFGGVSNFDGKNFTSYSKAEGLNSNSVNSIVEDNNGQMYFGTEAGINILTRGKIATLFKGQGVSNLVKDKNGRIWGLSKEKLFRIENSKPIFYSIANKAITALNTDKRGDVYAVAYDEGIYKLESKNWLLFQILPPNLKGFPIRKILFDRQIAGKMYLLTQRGGIYILSAGKISRFFKDKRISDYYSITQDNKNQMWIGTEKGVYMLANNRSVTSFNGDNGLSDNQVDAIFSDAEDNIWISCFSDGFFKYEGDAYIRYNKFKGQNLAFPVSGLAADKKENLWVGTYNKGLFKYNGNDIENINTPAFKDKKILFVYADKAKNIWISASGNGVWKYDGNKFDQVLPPEKLDNSSIVEDQVGGIWINGPVTSTYLKNGKSEKISGFDGYSSCMFALTPDSVLLGTSTGITLIKNKKVDKSFQISFLKGAFVLNIIKHGDNLVFATLGDGIVTWNGQTKAVKRYAAIDGLNSNDIYSLVVDNKKNLWAGTGRGINRLNFNRSSNSYSVEKGNPLIVECNQNAIINYRNNILVGTITGLVRCKTAQSIQSKQRPYIHIKQVNVFHKNDRSKESSLDLVKGSDQFHLLSYSENHISISFKAVYLTNPESVLYRYKLVGVDNDFSKPVPNTEIEYSSIRPGSYTFQVYAIANGEQSNIAQFNFTIIPPLYDTIWFKAAAFLVIIFLIWFLFYLIFKSRERKKQQLERIKMNEQEKIRKQTAEDFHDDIGNKLTRISVLSEILDKKVAPGNAEQKELVRLIKENAGLLYIGTKDILWALDPQSDNLYEILIHIKNFGIDLFQNTGIDFKMEGVLQKHRKLHLSMEFNRNLTLIFKEMLNNVLKHSNATQVLILIVESEDRTINILTTDDGDGFNLETVERGRGLKNIQTRCKRIKSMFQISSIEGKGTTTTISTKISVTN